jgi:hypothetical protein
MSNDNLIQKIIDDTLDFAKPVESFILLTDEEKQNLANNYSQAMLSSNPMIARRVTLEKFLTIYSSDQIPLVLVPNMHLTFQKAKAFEEAYIAAGGCELDWTSVFRSMPHHLRVYRQIAERKKVPFDESKVPKSSKHLKFLAWDCKPKTLPIKHLHDWVKKEEHGKMAELDLFFEDLSVTPVWLHAQVVPFGSYKDGGTRFFKI